MLWLASVPDSVAERQRERALISVVDRVVNAVCILVALLSEQRAVDSDENIMEGGVTIRRRRKTRAPVSLFSSLVDFFLPRHAHAKRMRSAVHAVARCLENTAVIV